MASLAPQVYQGYLELKVSPDQREIPVSPAAPAHLVDLDLMALRELKVTLVFPVYPELVAPPDLPLVAHRGSQAPPDPLDQWDPQDSLDQTERRETPALQV